MVMEEEPRWKIYKLLSEEVSRLIEGKVDINELVITKVLKVVIKLKICRI